MPGEKFPPKPEAPAGSEQEKDTEAELSGQLFTPEEEQRELASRLVVAIQDILMHAQSKVRVQLLDRNNLSNTEMIYGEHKPGPVLKFSMPDALKAWTYQPVVNVAGTFVKDTEDVKQYLVSDKAKALVEEAEAFFEKLVGKSG